MKKRFFLCFIPILLLVSAYAKGPSQLDPSTISEPVQVTTVSLLISTTVDTDNTGRDFMRITYPDFLEGLKKSVKDQTNVDINVDKFLEALQDSNDTITCELIDFDGKIKANQYTWSNPDKADMTTSASISVVFAIRDDQTLLSFVTIHQDDEKNKHGSELKVEVPLKIVSRDKQEEKSNIEDFIGIDDFNKTKSVALPIELNKKTYNTLAETDLTIQIHGTTVPTDAYYVDVTSERNLTVKVDAILKYGVHKKITYPIIELYNENGERIDGEVEKYGHAPPKGLDEDSIQEIINYKLTNTGRYYIYVYPEMRPQEEYTRTITATVMEIPVGFLRFAQSQYCKYKIVVK